jgi:serine/threonine protein kinase
LTEEALIDVMRQIASAVQSLHLQCIMHRDIKPSNVCVSNDGVVTLIDFEAGLRLSSRNALVSSQRVGTEGFLAPEIDQQHEYGFPADIYSLGRTLSWLHRSRMQAPPRLEHVVWRSVDALITSMLNPLSGKRPTIEVVNETLTAAFQNLRPGVPGENFASAFPLVTNARAPTAARFI